MKNIKIPKAMKKNICFKEADFIKTYTKKRPVNIQNNITVRYDQ
tara:strand:- start:10 stop:141 length:132 start_codon:yes stop_codon:yes gene_type:complete